MQRDQGFLLPPDMREWLPGDHLVWLVLEIVAQLDRSALHARHPRAGAGRAAYDPDMLLALLIYAYCQGVRSSRQIEQRCLTDVAFRVLCAQDVPDHTTIARFRVDHQEVFAGLFTQVLQVAATAGLARFGTVAIDGTKIAANASIDANRHRDWLVGEVDALLRDAAQVDTAEAAAHVEDDPDREGGGGQRMPPSLRDRSGRAERLRAALAEINAREHAEQQARQQRQTSAEQRLERAQAGESVVGRIPRGPHRLAEAQAHLARAVARQQAKLDRRAALIAAGRRPRGRPTVPVEQHPHVVRAQRAVDAALAEHAALAEQQPPPGAGHRPGRTSPKKAYRPGEAVANLSDPSSRLMPTRRGYLQGYNAQVAVTADQLIVAVQLGQSTNDQAAFVPMMHAAQHAADQLHQHTSNPEHVIGTVLADAGYASDANLAASGPDRLIALSKGREQAKTSRTSTVLNPIGPDATPRQQMRHRLRTDDGARLYKRRGATVEPGIGNLKKLLDRFSRRGLPAATSELHLAATAFNLRKIHRAAHC
ncbi:MAG TPA: transposase [Pseudonocardia sp.]